MTNKFNSGDKVWLGSTGIPATVVRSASNGVIVEYWGRGLRDGQLCIRRVSAKYLAARVSDHHQAAGAVVA